MGIRCVECQHENPDETLFCGKCGSRFPLSDEAAMSITRTIPAPTKFLVKGETFAGRYEIIDELGRGGMGIVYKAHDTKLRRGVALKFLPQELTHISELRDRFMREAQAAAVLDHPNICTVYEFDETEDKTFISMAFIEGESLKKKIDRGPLELDEAIKVAIQIAEGLQAAHDKGVVHRDIKSANIMVDERRQAKIMDFGLARISDSTLMTKEGMTMGTIAYMSPEQARGEKVDFRTDIWSFGVVLYEMFSGQLPFKGDHDQAVVYSILNERPKSITAMRPEIPTSIEQVIDKAMEKAPDNRYQNIAELLDDLKSISEGIVPEEIKVRLRKAKLRRRKRAILYGGSAGLLIILTVFLLTVLTGPAEAIDAIAVLPFENLTGDSEQEFFVDAVTDELIGQLSQIGSLRVISRYSVMQFKGMEKSLPEIAQELKVDAVVEGSVLRVGEDLRIRVQLIEMISEERNLWTQTYERDMTDVYLMYKEIARTIADKARVELTQQEMALLASARQVNPEAYEAYKKGMFHAYKLTSQDLELAKGYFELALEKDPNYALAHVGLGFFWQAQDQQGIMSHTEAGPKAEAASLKALELDDTLAEVHYLAAAVRTWGKWDWESAGKSFERAIELNPNFPDARAYYSWYLFIVGRPEEAMLQIERALELDPFNAAFRSLYAFDLMYARRFDDAITDLQETLRTAPMDEFALSAIRSAYHVNGMYDEAYEAWKKWYDVHDDSEAEQNFLRGYEEGGYSEALSNVAELMIERSKTRYITPWRIATVYTRAGKNIEALDFLEKAFEAHDANMPSIAVDPIFDNLRDEPRFNELLRKMNLPQAK